MAVAVEDEFVREVNAARSQPYHVAAQLQDTVPFFTGKLLRLPGCPRIVTNEGTSAVVEATGYLKGRDPVVVCRHSNGLSAVALSFAELLGRSEELDHTIKGSPSLDERLVAVGKATRPCAELVCVLRPASRNCTARRQIHRWIVDDGLVDRPNRKALFHAEHRAVGVGVAQHPTQGTVCVLILAGDFVPHGDGRDVRIATELPSAMLDGACERCLLPAGEDRVLVGGAQLHTRCFSCSLCRKLLTAGSFIVKGGNVHCLECVYRCFSENCLTCQRPLLTTIVNALGRKWHRECFACTHCGTPLAQQRFCRVNGAPYCMRCGEGALDLAITEDDTDAFLRCQSCLRPVVDGSASLVGGLLFHRHCLTCAVCGTGVEMDCYVQGARVLCRTHFVESSGPMCSVCGASIPHSSLEAMGRVFHPACFKCTGCGRSFAGGATFVVRDGSAFCSNACGEQPQGEGGPVR